MLRPYKQRVPQNISEIRDFLGMMMLSSPKFIDRTGYFPHRNISTVFIALNESFELIKTKIGEERYFLLMQMSDRMRAHFEADPEDKTEESLKGREIINEMDDLLKQVSRNRRVWKEPSEDAAD